MEFNEKELNLIKRVVGLFIEDGYGFDTDEKDCLFSTLEKLGYTEEEYKKVFEDYMT